MKQALVTSCVEAFYVGLVGILCQLRRAFPPTEFSQKRTLKASFLQEDSKFNFKCRTGILIVFFMTFSDSPAKGDYFDRYSTGTFVPLAGR
jgi:hypothetical protein